MESIEAPTAEEALSLMKEKITAAIVKAHTSKPPTKLISTTVSLLRMPWSQERRILFKAEDVHKP